MDEQYEDIQTECPNCKISFKIKDMRLNPDTDRLFCINCANNPGARVERIR